ncbi:MAG: transcriptional repressor [Puniceicoccales bacterium]|jgi:Fe2+ or Zn2+ uptake regulation protein|nr:transcriptional repressor [Puniceicoccales bacterium]
MSHHTHIHTHPHEHPHHASENYDAAIARLHKTGLRVTTPRKAMLRALTAASGPVSIETLHQSLLPGVADLVTVYRSVLAFLEAGIVQRHPLENGKSLYCLTDARPHSHHHHIICRQCGRMDEIDGCVAEKFETLARNHGYTQISHVFEIYGVCEKCSPRSQPAPKP